MIDLAGAVEHPDLCDAALSYLLERMRLEVEDPSEAARLKLMVVDEAWRYLQDPAVLSYLAEAAKTWRSGVAAEAECVSGRPRAVGVGLSARGLPWEAAGRVRTHTADYTASAMAMDGHR